MSTEEQNHPPHEVVPAPSPSAPAQPPQQVTIATILDKLTNLPNLNADTLVKLVDAHLELQREEAKSEFHRHMNLVQQEIDMVMVNQKNPHTSSLFIDLTALHAQAKPIWTKHGFSVMTTTAPSEEKDCFKILCTVSRAHGTSSYSVTSSDDWPTDDKGLAGKASKTPVQGKASTITFARRYIELAAFDIAVSKTDRDGVIIDVAPVASSSTNEKLIKAGILNPDGTPKK